MSSSRYVSSRTQDPREREFLVSTEIYVSLASGASLPKPVVTRKKAERRDHHGRMLVGQDDNWKLKEKSSFHALAKGPSNAGHWRPATCKLSEEGERCLLNIYVDESILYQTLYIHLLNHSDIRLADTSLFFRKDCLSIYCVAGQRWSSYNTAEPVYLQFPNTDACNTWLALLRSYSIPEVYGRLFFPADGGSYRMWRQVDLTVMTGRNLGNTREIAGSGDPDSPDSVDFDLSCEVHLNDTICGRTTVKKGVASPEWHEDFTFADLPPFDNLDLVVWRDKKLFKPMQIGTARIPLTNFRRGEALEAWYPVVQQGVNGSDIRVGEIRLKIRVDEEIILPYSAYSQLLTTFNSRNFLDWMADFENKLKLNTITSHLLSVTIANNKLVDHVQQLASREVEGPPSALQTLFRGNSILSKVMEQSMVRYGMAFLDASLGPVLRRLCAEKVAIETDIVRSNKGPRDYERNAEVLVHWLGLFWNQIYSMRNECPHDLDVSELRRLFEAVRTQVERGLRRHRMDDSVLQWQSVSAFCFLRFIVPAILHPHLFGLCPGLPSLPIRRSLTLIAKAIQQLANLNTGAPKENHMRCVLPFIVEHRNAMIDYILVVSNPSKEGYAHSGSMYDRHDRLNVVNSLRERGSMKPVLDREAIPMLPHLLDIPRHLAIITSAVIRRSRDYLAQDRTGDANDKALFEFCSKCFAVEEHALTRVSQLATRISSGHRRPSASGSWANMKPLRSPSSPISAGSSPGRRRAAKRPSTAPSMSDSDKSQKRSALAQNALNKSPTFTRDSPALKGSQLNLLHYKSPSTDSFTGQPFLQPDSPDDLSKRKGGLFKGMLRLVR